MEFNLFQNRAPLISVERKGWKLFKFTDILKDDTKEATKIKKENYLLRGKYPIIDQGKQFIAGYYNDETGLYKNYPNIIFGDHTRILKYIDFPIYLGADGVKLFKVKDDINIKYIYYFLNSVDLPNDGYSRHYKYLKDIIIPIPNVKTQEKIVEFLDKSQELIEKRKEQIEALDELVKSRFIEMFGDPIINSKGWDTIKLGDIMLKGNINIPSSEKYWNLNLDVIEPGTGKIIKKIIVDVDEIGSSTYPFNNNMVLYSKLRPYLNKVVIPDGYGMATTELVPLIPNDKQLKKIFLAELLRSESFVRYANTLSSGARMPRMPMNEFRKFRCIVPSLKLQEDFCNIVKQTDKLKEDMEASLKELEDNFNSLMQRAFKGELFN